MNIRERACYENLDILIDFIKDCRSIGDRYVEKRAIETLDKWGKARSEYIKNHEPPEENMKRYFLLMYSCFIRDSNVVGHLKLRSDGEYVNLEIAKSIIATNLNSRSLTSSVSKDSIFITNIIELSEQDYKDFSEEYYD